MKTTRWIPSLALLVTTVTACSSTSSDDIDDKDGGVVGGAAAHAFDAGDEGETCGRERCEELPGDDRLCPYVIEGQCESELFRSFELIVTASDLGEGLRFVTLRDRLVMAEDESGRPFVFAFDRFPEEPPLSTLRPLPFDPPPPEGMRAKAVSGSGQSGVAILCDEAGCIVHRAEEEGENVVLRRVSTPSDGRRIEGAFTSYRYELCVYGEGLHCLREGQWETLDDGSKGKILAAGRRGQWLVGEKGRALYFDIDGESGTGGCVREVETGIDVDLFAVEGDSIAWAVGAEGHAVALSPCEARACRIDESDFRNVVVGDSGLQAYLTSDGERVRWTRYGFCSDDLPNASSYAVARCGSAMNVWALTPDEIRGEVRCMGTGP